MGDIVKKDSQGKSVATTGGNLDFDAMRKRKQLLLPGGSTPDPLIQAVWMFDITGSTYSYFDTIRTYVREISLAVNHKVAKSEFSIFAFRNHGDENNFDQVFYARALTSNVEQIYYDACNIESGGGGIDGLTCMEECLREANNLEWSKHASKVIVIIGDQPPHGVLDRISKCPNEINYQEEITKLKEKGVKIYMVFCGHKDEVRDFYRSVAKDTGGRFLEISELDILKDLIIGICMKETGNLGKFKEDLRKAHKLDSKTEKTLLLLE